MRKLEIPARFATFEALGGAVQGLQADQGCATQFIAGGDKKAWKLLAHELLAVGEPLINSEQLVSVSLGAKTQPVFSAEPDQFAFDIRALDRFKRELKQETPNFVAQVVPSAEPSGSHFGFRWVGRLVVISFKTTKNGSRTHDANAAFEANGDIEVLRYERPSYEQLRHAVKEFRTASQTIKKKAKGRLKAVHGEDSDFSVTMVADGLLQFATMAPFKTIAFGQGIGRDAIKRAQISLEADVKLARRGNAPSQLQMLHEWWLYRDADPEARLQPLLLR